LTTWHVREASLGFFAANYAAILADIHQGLINCVVSAQVQVVNIRKHQSWLALSMVDRLCLSSNHGCLFFRKTMLFVRQVIFENFLLVGMLDVHPFNARNTTFYRFQNCVIGRYHAILNIRLGL
jgi:hypothetical protein